MKIKLKAFSKMNKKGFITEGISDIFHYSLFVIFLILFLFLMDNQLPELDKEMIGDFNANTDDVMNLITFLETPISQTETMTDFIRRIKPYDGTKVADIQTFKKKVGEILNVVYYNKKYWIRIYNEKEEIKPLHLKPNNIDLDYQTYFRTTKYSDKSDPCGGGEGYYCDPSASSGGFQTDICKDNYIKQKIANSDKIVVMCINDK